MKPGCTFIDGIERNRANPLTFEIPTPGAKAKLQPGQYVKIGVMTPNGGPTERFWVQVFEIEGKTIKGRVNNDLVYINHHGIDDGDPISFEYRNILDIVS